MHKVQLDPAVVESALKRRQAHHAFSDLDPRKTALLVIDLQRAYLDESLHDSFCRDALDIVPNVNRIAQALRQAGGLVGWIQNTATDESMTSWSNYNNRLLNQARRDKRYAGIREGSAGHELWPGLDVKTDD